MSRFRVFNAFVAVSLLLCLATMCLDVPELLDAGGCYRAGSASSATDANWGMGFA